MSFFIANSSKFDDRPQVPACAVARGFGIGHPPAMAYALSYLARSGINALRAAAFVIVAATPTVCVAVASPRVATLSASDRAAIRELETRSWVAWKNHDAAFFGQFLADDHVEVHTNGIAGKAAVIEGVRSSACTVKDYSIGPLSLVPVSADTALVTYRAEQNTACGRARVPSPVWATSLYAKRAGRWVNVLYQQTPAM